MDAIKDVVSTSVLTALDDGLVPMPALGSAPGTDALALLQACKGMALKITAFGFDQQKADTRKRAVVAFGDLVRKLMACADECSQSRGLPTIPGQVARPAVVDVSTKIMDPHSIVVYLMRDHRRKAGIATPQDDEWFKEFGHACVKANGTQLIALLTRKQDMKPSLDHALDVIYSRKTSEVWMFGKQFGICGCSECAKYMNDLCGNGSVAGATALANDADASHDDESELNESANGTVEMADEDDGDGGAAGSSSSAAPEPKKKKRKKIHVTETYTSIYAAMSLCFLVKARLHERGVSDDGWINDVMETLFIRSQFFRIRNRRTIALLVHMMFRNERFDSESLDLPDAIHTALNKDAALKSECTQRAIGQVWSIMQSLAVSFFVKPLHADPPKEPSPDILNDTNSFRWACDRIGAVRDNWTSGHGTSLHDAVAMLAFGVQAADAAGRLSLGQLASSQNAQARETLCYAVNGVLNRLSERSTTVNKQGGFASHAVHCEPSFLKMSEMSSSSGIGAFGNLDASAKDLMFAPSNEETRNAFLSNVHQSIERLNGVLSTSAKTMVNGNVKLDSLLKVVWTINDRKEESSPVPEKFYVSADPYEHLMQKLLQLVSCRLNDVVYEIVQMQAKIEWDESAWANLIDAIRQRDYAWFRDETAVAIAVLAIGAVCRKVDETVALKYKNFTSRIITVESRNYGYVYLSMVDIKEKLDGVTRGSTLGSCVETARQLARAAMMMGLGKRKIGGGSGSGAGSGAGSGSGSGSGSSSGGSGSGAGSGSGSGDGPSTRVSEDFWTRTHDAESGKEVLYNPKTGETKEINPKKDSVKLARLKPILKRK